jgi:hypothetical protein
MLSTTPRSGADPQESDATWKQRIKLQAVEALGRKCCVCGYSRCVDVLHFHHADATLKEFTISEKSWSWERLLNELKKCALVCANCHGEIHAGLASLPLSAVLDTVYRDPWEE